MTEHLPDKEALEWQTGVWNRISDVYVREIDQRFAPVVDAVLSRSELSAGDRVLDLGAGTGCGHQSRNAREGTRACGGGRSLQRPFA